MPDYWHGEDAVAEDAVARGFEEAKMRLRKGGKGGKGGKASSSASSSSNKGGKGGSK